MDIEIIFKLFALAILVVSINMILSKCGKDEYSTLVNISGVVIALLFVIREAKYLYDYVVSVFGL